MAFLFLFLITSTKVYKKDKTIPGRHSLDKKGTHHPHSSLTLTDIGVNRRGTTVTETGKRGVQRAGCFLGQSQGRSHGWVTPSPPLIGGRPPTSCTASTNHTRRPPLTLLSFIARKTARTKWYWLCAVPPDYDPEPRGEDATAKWKQHPRLCLLPGDDGSSDCNQCSRLSHPRYIHSGYVYVLVC